MRIRDILGPAAVLVLGALSAQPAYATFHFMQIEQVMGGVNGDTAAQAIQLRMRSPSQHSVAQARLCARDAAGANPVLLIDIGSNLSAPSSAGDRILIATPSFAATTTPTAVPNFSMLPIPAAYLAAGSLTFEGDTGMIYWRLSWGGSSYTGSNGGETDNDNNLPGDFGPPFAGRLSSDNCYALQFQGSAGAESTSNSLQYAETASAATFTNYAGNSFTIETCIPAVSAWGLFVMTLLLLSAATVVVVRRSRMTARC